MPVPVISTKRHFAPLGLEISAWEHVLIGLTLAARSEIRFSRRVSQSVSVAKSAVGHARVSVFFSAGPLIWRVGNFWALLEHPLIAFITSGELF